MDIFGKFINTSPLLLLDPGIIAGIVIGSLLILTLIIVGIVCCCKKCHEPPQYYPGVANATMMNLTGPVGYGQPMYPPANYQPSSYPPTLIPPTNSMQTLPSPQALGGQNPAEGNITFHG